MNTTKIILYFWLQVFKQIARTYADAHATMSEGNSGRCENFGSIGQDGIINGAWWYSFAGGKFKII